MKCLVCNQELENGIARCTVCGFPVIPSVQVTPEELQSMQELKEDFLRKKLSAVLISVIAYDYIVENREITQVGENRIVIAKGEDLISGNILWCEKDFEKIESKRSVNIKAVIKKCDNSEQRVDIEVNTKEIDNVTNIGIMLDDSLTIKFAVGNKEKYIFSENYKLV